MQTNGFCKQASETHRILVRQAQLLHDEWCVGAEDLTRRKVTLYQHLVELLTPRSAQ